MQTDLTLPQQAQIHLNDARAKSEMDGFRSFHSFNFGSYQVDERTPLERLYVLNDDTLAGGNAVPLSVEEPTQIVLLPIVGSVSCNEALVNSAELMATQLAAGDNISIRNPFSKKSDLVNYIQLWFTTKATSVSRKPTISGFDIEKNRDKLVYLPLPPSYPRMCIGKYKGRTKDEYEPSDLSSGVYAFVIQGAFEVEDRLLHARDGLALTGFPSIGFEALSNEAILLLIETGGEEG